MRLGAVRVSLPAVAIFCLLAVACNGASSNLGVAAIVAANGSQQSSSTATSRQATGSTTSSSGTQQSSGLATSQSGSASQASSPWPQSAANNSFAASMVKESAAAATAANATNSSGSTNKTCRSQGLGRNLPTGSFGRKGSPPVSNAAQLTEIAPSWAASLVNSIVNGKAKCQECEADLTNWGGNFQFTPSRIVYPRSTQEVSSLVQNCNGPMRAVGNRHSFSTIANTNGTLVSLSAMTQILGVAPDLSNVTVQAGIKYTDLVPFLDAVGLAIPNMASLAEISIAGAISTAVHGSGVTHKNLPSQVIGVTIVVANGTALTLTEAANPDLMKAVRVGLGSLGIITEVTLATVPAFQAQTCVFLNLSIAELVKNFDTIMSDAYAVYLWSDWADPNMLTQVWLMSNLDSNNYTNYSNVANYYNATAATEKVTPLAALPTPYVADQLCTVAPWYQRMTNYGLGLSGFNGAEIETEYFVAISNATAAIQALQPLAAQINPLCYVFLVRSVAPDDAYMSTANTNNTNGEVSVTLHFTWLPDLANVTALLPKIEAALAPFEPVPHWGKYYTMDPCTTYLKKYKHLNAFRAVVKEFDPHGKFRNAFVNDNVFVKCK